MTSFAHDLERAGIPLALVDKLIEPGSQSLVGAMQRAVQALIRPVKMDIVEWAEANVVLPVGMGYASGPFRALPYQKGIMRCWQDDSIERVIFKKVPRCGASFITAIAILYMAFHEGQDVICYERSKGKAQTFWEQYLDPLIEASPTLKALRRPRHVERWHDMILLNGAALRSRGADDARAIKGKWVFIEEGGDDAWLPDSGGDKPDRIANRAAAFGDGILSMAGSPLVKQTCQITKGYDLSDKRTYRVECPHCATRQELLPSIQPGDGQPGLYYRVDQETGEVSQYTDPVSRLTTPDIWYRCVTGCEIRETYKTAMNESGEWVSTRPDAIKGGRRWAGFHLSALYSMDPKSRWIHIVSEYLAQLVDPSKRQTFRNERLGLEWDAETVRAVEPHWVRQRRAFAFPAPCPPVVGAATVGSDNQTGALSDEKQARTGRTARSEISVVGWGPQEQSVVLAHIVCPHVPFSSESNEFKLKVMQTKFHLPDGSFITPAAAADDIGDGNTVDAAIQFVSSKEARSLLWDGIIGVKESFGSRAPTIGHGKAKHGHWEYERIKKQSAADVLIGRLSLDGFGPGTITFPKNDHFGDGYFRSLTAVKRLQKEGNDAYSWEDMEDNEAFDTWIYAYARHLLLKRNLPGVAHVFENPALDRKGEWAKGMIRDGRPDRSWQSALCEAERRVTGGLTAEDYTLRRLIVPKKDTQVAAGHQPASPPGHQAAPPATNGFAPRPAPAQQQHRPGGSPYGRVGRPRGF